VISCSDDVRDDDEQDDGAHPHHQQQPSTHPSVIAITTTTTTMSSTKVIRLACQPQTYPCANPLAPSRRLERNPR
jgi:hypothetical protein